MKELQNLKDPETGEQIISRLYLKEEIYQGKYLKNAPDILFILNDGYVASELLKGDVIEKLPRIKGVHHLDGMFICYGKEIAKGRRMDAKIVDIMPTILHYMGLPIPHDVDGKVLKEIFEENSEAFGRKIVYTKKHIIEKEILKEKIRELKKAKKI